MTGMVTQGLGAGITPDAAQVRYTFMDNTSKLGLTGISASGDDTFSSKDYEYHHSKAYSTYSVIFTKSGYDNKSLTFTTTSTNEIVEVFLTVTHPTTSLSDATIMAAIKTLIEGDSDLYNSDGPNNPTLINKVYTEPPLSGHNQAQRNYCEIIPPDPDAATLDLDSAPTGGQELFFIPFTIKFYFKQIRKENNARIYDAVKNFRDAINADPTLSTSGIEKAQVTARGYNFNPDNQSIVDNAELTLGVVTIESF